MAWQDLITASRHLIATQDPADPPSPDFLRRAISTAYYAAFRALADSNADCLIGNVNNPTLEYAWRWVNRGLDHSAAKRNLKRDRQRFSRAVQEFIETFAALQDARHTADYDTSREFTTSEASAWVDRAERAITSFLDADIEERRAVATSALIKGRSS